MNWKHLLLCCTIAISICGAQILGNALLLLLCLGAFLFLIIWSCIHECEVQTFLFYLPWSMLLRLSPNSVSFFTLALLTAGIIGIIRHGFALKSYFIGAASILLVTTLLSKLLHRYSLEYGFLTFMAMLILYPMLNIGNGKYRFYHLTIYFSLGIILAALTAQQFASFPNIARYIRVDSYLSITRRCGYYNDPNFYTAHITAAIAGCFILMLDRATPNNRYFLAILLGLLVYCGFLSGSKSFLIISLLLVVIWVLEVFSMQGRLSTKLALLLGLAVFIGYVLFSSVFQDKIDVILTRLSYSSNVADLTTHRTEIWQMYADEILNHEELLILGQGFTNVKVNGRGSHNTVIQLIYQFGVVGGTVLLAWLKGLYNDLTCGWQVSSDRYLRVFLVIVGAILPWLAIDILFFDELFLITTYVGFAIRDCALSPMMDGKGKRREHAKANP